MTILAQAQAALPPEACFITGFCPVPVEATGVPAGLMFIALGLVIVGVAGLRGNRWTTR